MRKSLLLTLTLLLSFCTPKFQPEKFSFPLNEEKEIKIDGAPLYFDGKLILTDKKEAIKIVWKGQEAEFVPYPWEKKKMVEENVLRIGDEEYYGTKDGFVIAKRKGKIKWKRRIGAGVVAKPAVYKKFLFVPSLDGHLYAFKKSTGSLLWIKKLPGRGKFPPLIIDKIIVAPSLSKKIRGFSLDGRQKWDYSLKATLMFPLHLAPGKRLVAVEYDWEEGKTLIQILRKKLGLEIKLLPDPPVKIGEGAEIKVKLFGFYYPNISFYINGVLLNKGEDTKILWLPEQEGIYTIKAVVEEGGIKREETLKVRVIDPEAQLLRYILRSRVSCYWRR